MYIIDPDPFVAPAYRISPFRTSDISFNNELDESSLIDTYFSKRFVNRKFVYCKNARNAIYLALTHYNLKEDDYVTILTTTNNFYISSCVTSEIEKFCKWSREITPATKVIFVNHEFGYPFENLEGLKKYKLPIIEDCAHAFFSSDENHNIGKVGDFVIYSFPKMFPIQ
ncbi:MAG: DegT/DnrJ/EryC1/StrS aminotransferase family protein, partial [Flavobacteriaceae bacterium]|nr:DegT/DnrJ/EryC1/StrS aminotransferase family protein [Flavobacteriaceae bacterium]